MDGTGEKNVGTRMRLRALPPAKGSPKASRKARVKTQPPPAAKPATKAPAQTQAATKGTKRALSPRRGTRTRSLSQRRRQHLDSLALGRAQREQAAAGPPGETARASSAPTAGAAGRKSKGGRSSVSSPPPDQVRSLALGPGGGVTPPPRKPSTRRSSSKGLLVPCLPALGAAPPSASALSAFTPYQQRASSSRPAAPQSGWERLVAGDGDGAIILEILSFFLAPIAPEDDNSPAPVGSPVGSTGAGFFWAGATQEPLAATAKECLIRRDLLAMSEACKLMARAADQALGRLIVRNPHLPADPALTASYVPPPLDDEEEEPATDAPEYHTLIASRSGLATFVAHPERRVRAYTACDNRGRQALDALFGNPVFCVRYRGIRQGNALYPASGPGRPRAAVDCTAAWPLQLHTYFKMRTYTKFERLMGVYAGRSHLPLPWLRFEVADRLYGKPTNLAKTAQGAAEAAAAAAAAAVAHKRAEEEAKRRALTSPGAPPLSRGPRLKGTNNGCLPLLARGGRIKPSHSLWTIGIEPGDGGLPFAGEPAGPGGGADNAAESDELEQDVAAEQAAVQGGGPAGPAAAAPAPVLTLAEEQLEDVWVDSYLTCAEDECFVCVRDKRGDPRQLAAGIKCAAQYAAASFDEGEASAMRTVGEMPGGDQYVIGGETGVLGPPGRYSTVDGGLDLPFATRDEDPGQPVRPQHFGWLFKMKQGARLGPLLDRVMLEISGVPTSVRDQPSLREARIGSRTEAKWGTIHFTSASPKVGAPAGWVPVRRGDRAVDATARAVLGAGPAEALGKERAAAMMRGLGPMHVLEMHDLKSVTTNLAMFRRGAAAGPE